MFGAEPTKSWWRRPVALAGAGGVVAGVVIGGASQSLPAASTHPISGSTVTGPARITVTVAAPTPTVTLLHTATRTITVVVTSTKSGPLPQSSLIGVTTTVSAAPSASQSSVPAPSAPAASPSAPTNSEPPVLGPGPTTYCKDGTVSPAKQGGCAHHGGAAAGHR